MYPTLQTNKQKKMSGKMIIGLFSVNSATVHSRRLLPFLRDVLISLVKKARRAIDTWCMFSSSAKPSLYCCNNALSTAATASFPGLDSDPDSPGKIAKYEFKVLSF